MHMTEIQRPELKRDVSNTTKDMNPRPLEDIKGSPSLIIVGIQKTGKSSFLNCLIGMPLSSTKTSFCTKCAIEYDLIREENKDRWEMTVNGELVTDVHGLISNLNKWMDRMDDVDSTSYIQVRVVGLVPITMKIIDTPGFVCQSDFKNPDPVIDSRNQGIINILLGLGDELGSYFVVVSECPQEPDVQLDVKFINDLLLDYGVLTRGKIVVLNKLDVRLQQWPEGKLDKFINKGEQFFYCSSNWGNIIRDDTPIVEQLRIYQNMNTYEESRLKDLRVKLSEQNNLKIGLKNVYNKLLKMFDEILRSKRSQMLSSLKLKKSDIEKKLKLIKKTKQSVNPFYDLVCSLTSLSDHIITYHTLIIINGKSAIGELGSTINKMCEDRGFNLKAESYGNKLYWDTYKILREKVDEMVEKVITDEHAGIVLEAAVFEGKSPDQIIEATILLFFGDVEQLIEEHTKLLTELVLLQIDHVILQCSDLILPHSITNNFQALVDESRDRILEDLSKDIINKKNTMNMKEEKGQISKPVDTNDPNYVAYYKEQAVIKMKHMTNLILTSYINSAQTQLIRIFLRENKDLFIREIAKYLDFVTFTEDLKQLSEDSNEKISKLEKDVLEIEKDICRYASN